MVIATNYFSYRIFHLGGFSGGFSDPGKMPLVGKFPTVFLPDFSSLLSAQIIN
jgi:hypothetical protein